MAAASSSSAAATAKKEKPDYTALRELFQPHIDSFDYFVDKGMELTVKSIRPCEFVIKDTDTKIRIYFGDPKFNFPKDSKIGRSIYPQECREARTTYKGEFMVETFIQFNDGAPIRYWIHFGHLPIMLMVDGKLDERYEPTGACRRDFRSSDLRDKLERRHSPNRRYSPERDARSYHAFRGQKPLSHERGSSRSRSPGRKSERGHRRKVDVDGERDDSESRKISEDAEDLRREDKVSEYDEKYALEEQLKQMQSDIDRLEDDKSQLQHILEEKVDDAQKLSSKIQDIEFQLSKEQEDCIRITSKIKRFVRAHGHYLKAEEEFKRVQARLQRLGNQLGSDILKPDATEEDSSVNVFSDGEPNGDDPTSRIKELKNDLFSVKKRPYVLSATSEEAKAGKFEGNSQKEGRYSGLFAHSENITQSEGPAHQVGTDDKETESKKAIQHKKEADKSLSDDYKHKRGRTNPSNTKLKRVKSSEAGHVLPSTSMAAHAVDDLIEAVEMEEKSEPMESSAYESRVSERKANSISMPPPPPPIDLNAYRQYEGNDQDVDVERVENEMLDIDLNSEVDIEQ